MSGSKLGICMIEHQTQAMLWAIENKPTAMEFMMVRPLDTRPMEQIPGGPKVSQVELMQMLAMASPKTLLIIRAYPDDYDHPDFQDRMIEWSKPFRKVSDRVVAHSINEPQVFNAEEAKRLNDYELGFIERMTKEGLIPMCFCLSESHLARGNMGLWQYMTKGVALLAEADGFLGFNEYDYPVWDRSRDEGYKWRLGHWEHNLAELQKWLGAKKIPQVGIGEGIFDGGVSPYGLKHTGWQKVHDARSHLANIKAIVADSYHDPRLALHLLFAWAPRHHDWDNFDVSLMKDLLAQHLRENPPIYWEKEGQMGVWENVEKHRPDVAKFKKEIGAATAAYSVPISDYMGIPVSPAKAMAVIIALEGKPANPNQVVEFDEKKDGKPTGRKLHAVGLCGIVAEHVGKTIEQLKDPYTNIIEGLKILQSKLKSSNGVLRGAYYYYTGGSYWPSMEEWVNKIWLGKFVPIYKQFWGIGLEAEVSPPDPIQEALKHIERAKAALEAGWTEVGAQIIEARTALDEIEDKFSASQREAKRELDAAVAELMGN